MKSISLSLCAASRADQNFNESVLFVFDMSEFFNNPEINDVCSDSSMKVDTDIPTEEAESCAEDSKTEKQGDIVTDPYIADDIAFIREFVAPSAINSLSSYDISVTIVRTAYARIQLSVVYNVGYPYVLPGIELSSPSLPFSLLRNKEKECQDNAKKALATFKARQLADGSNVCGAIPTPGLVAAIYSTIHNFIHTNMFVPCWKEMKQLITFCKESSIGGANADVDNASVSACCYKLKCDEILGLITLHLQNKGYFLHIKVTVPEEYPEEGIKVSTVV